MRRAYVVLPFHLVELRIIAQSDWIIGIGLAHTRLHTLRVPAYSWLSGLV